MSIVLVYFTCFWWFYEDDSVECIGYFSFNSNMLPRIYISILISLGFVNILHSLLPQGHKVYSLCAICIVVSLVASISRTCMHQVSVSFIGLIRIKLKKINVRYHCMFIRFSKYLRQNMFNLDAKKVECALGTKEFIFGRARNQKTLCTLCSRF